MSSKKHNPWNALGFYVRVILFTVIEVIAALQLEGWTAVGIWFIAAWNVFLGIAATAGFVIKAVAAMNAEADR